jgi:hypothetical protein
VETPSVRSGGSPETRIGRPTIPRNQNRTTDDPTCRKKWGWILVWPVLATPAFQSARVEAVAYNVPDASTTVAGLYVIPEGEADRAELAARIVADSYSDR